MEQTITNKPMIDRRKAFSAIDIELQNCSVGRLYERKNELTYWVEVWHLLWGKSWRSYKYSHTVSSIKVAVKQAEEEAGFL